MALPVGGVLHVSVALGVALVDINRFLDSDTYTNGPVTDLSCQAAD